MNGRRFALLAAMAGFAGCQGTVVNGAVTGAAASSSGGVPTTAGASSSAAGSSGSSGGVVSTGTGTGTSSGGGTSTGTAAGSSTGAVSCGTGLVWAGDQCRPIECAQSIVGAACLLQQGGVGTCSEFGCEPVNLQTDPNNCGFFGLVCPAPTVCFNGQCFDPASGPPSCVEDSCGPEQICFAGFGCVLSYSYCGEPGTEGQACFPLFATDQQRPGICCGEGCARVDADRYNCGRCGVSCSGCENGICFDFPVSPVVCNGINNRQSCGLPDAGVLVCCGGACVDAISDSRCNACEIACPIGSSCVNGGCLEPGDGGTASCASASDCPTGHGCRNGGCLTTVCGTGSDNEVCLDGAGDLATCCNESCADLSSDPKNCGLCGVACGEGELCLNRSCVSLSSGCQNGSVCVLGDGRLGTCCGSRCVDWMNDPVNCGECGDACPIGSSCGLDGYAYCSPDGGAFASCAQDSDCVEGLSCVSGDCESFSCDGGATHCAYDAGGTAVVGTCCGLTCVGDSDPNNCEYCNEVCPGDGGCDHGYCLGSEDYLIGCGSCPPGAACVIYDDEYYNCFLATCGVASDGQMCAFGPNLLGTCCGGRCVNASSDPGDCGGCGMSCSSGVCYRGACAATRLSSPCDVSCPAGTSCEFDSCLGSGCDSVTDVCLAADGTLGVCCPDGDCAHPLDDPENCGGCGRPCPPGQACVAGACSGSPACGPAEANGFCNLDGGLSWLCCPGAGCTDTTLDPSNCGACGTVCPAGKSCSSEGCG